MVVVAALASFSLAREDSFEYFSIVLVKCLKTKTDRLASCILYSSG